MIATLAAIAEKSSAIAATATIPGSDALRSGQQNTEIPSSGRSLEPKAPMSIKKQPSSRNRRFTAAMLNLTNGANDVSDAGPLDLH